MRPVVVCLLYCHPDRNKRSSSASRSGISSVNYVAGNARILFTREIPVQGANRRYANGIWTPVRIRPDTYIPFGMRYLRVRSTMGGGPS